MVHRLLISAGWANNAACVGSAVRIGWLRCSYVALRMGYRLASLGLERRLGAWITGLGTRSRGDFTRLKHSLDHRKRVRPLCHA